jgi:tripartite-type tricarboxylate transporter receptor subunit TctC
MKRIPHILALLLLLLPSAPGAQEWPSRPVVLIVAAAAGSAPDVIARLLADRLAATLGKAVIVDNKPGAAGVIGTDAGAKAAPDGYTLLFSQAAPLALTKFTHAKLPYDVQNDFQPVINVGISPMIIAAAPQLNVDSLNGLIKLAKERPGQLSFATSSSRNVPHLTGELLKSLAGIDLIHVPARNSQTAISDLLTGRVALYVDGVPVIGPLVADGRVKALVVTSLQRLPGLENLPTLSETFPGTEINGWFAIVAPQKTPADIITRVNRELQSILSEPDVVERFRKLGVFPVGGSPQQLREFISADLKRWERAAAAAHLDKQ